MMRQRAVSWNARLIFTASRRRSLSPAACAYRDRTVQGLGPASTSPRRMACALRDGLQPQKGGLYEPMCSRVVTGRTLVRAVMTSVGVFTPCRWRAANRPSPFRADSAPRELGVRHDHRPSLLRQRNMHRGRCWPMLVRAAMGWSEDGRPAASRPPRYRRSARKPGHRQTAGRVISKFESAPGFERLRTIFPGAQSMPRTRWGKPNSRVIPGS